MNPLLLAPLIIGEATVPAFHNQLELLISRDSGIVTGHVRYLHKCIVKYLHLSMKCILFQSEVLASNYHYEVFGYEAPATLTFGGYLTLSVYDTQD